jgi:hypothetical protein
MRVPVRDTEWHDVQSPCTDVGAPVSPKVVVIKFPVYEAQ